MQPVLRDHGGQSTPSVGIDLWTDSRVLHAGRCGGHDSHGVAARPQSPLIPWLPRRIRNSGSNSHGTLAPEFLSEPRTCKLFLALTIFVSVIYVIYDYCKLMHMRWRNAGPWDVSHWIICGGCCNDHGERSVATTHDRRHHLLFQWTRHLSQRQGVHEGT